MPASSSFSFSLLFVYLHRWCTCFMCDSVKLQTLILTLKAEETCQLLRFKFAQSDTWVGLSWAHYAPLRVLISSGIQTLIGAAIFTATPLWVWRERRVAKLQCFVVCAYVLTEVTLMETWGIQRPAVMCRISFCIFQCEFVFVLGRWQTGGEALPQIQGDGKKVRQRGFCLLQLQRPPVVSFRLFVYVRGGQKQTPVFIFFSKISEISAFIPM